MELCGSIRDCGGELMIQYNKKTFFHRVDFPYFMDRYLIQPNEYIPQHKHEFYELVYVLGGTAVHDLQGQRKVLRDGDMYLLEPGQSHGYVGSSAETPVYNIMFLPELLQQRSTLKKEDIFTYLSPFLGKSKSDLPYVSLTGVLRGMVESELSQLYDEYRRRLPGYETIIQGGLARLYIQIARHDACTNKAADRNNQIGRVLSMLRERFSQPLTLRQFSQLCYMSPSTLNYQLKQSTGKTYSETKRELQLEFACRQLRETQDEIAQIAFDSGFDDISYFYRIFKKHVNCTPVQYRKQFAGLDKKLVSFIRRTE